MFPGSVLAQVTPQRVFFVPIVHVAAIAWRSFPLYSSGGMQRMGGWLVLCMDV